VKVSCTELDFGIFGGTTSRAGGTVVQEERASIVGVEVASFVFATLTLDF
jgi:hypothetical protein